MFYEVPLKVSDDNTRNVGFFDRSVMEDDLEGKIAEVLTTLLSLDRLYCIF